MPKLRNRILSVALSIVVVLAAAFYLQSTKLDSQTPPELEANSELTGALTTGSGAAYYYDVNSPDFTGDVSNTVSANADSKTYFYSDRDQTFGEFLGRIDGINSTMVVNEVEVPGQFRFLSFGHSNGSNNYFVYPLEYYESNYSSNFSFNGFDMDTVIPRNQVLIAYSGGEYNYQENPTTAEMGNGLVSLNKQGWHYVYLTPQNSLELPYGYKVFIAYKYNMDGSFTEVYRLNRESEFEVNENAIYWVSVRDFGSSDIPAVPSDQDSQVADTGDVSSPSTTVGSPSVPERGNATQARDADRARTVINQTNTSIGDIDVNCYNSLMGSGNSIGDLSSSCNRLDANIETDNPEVIGALLASLNSDQNPGQQAQENQALENGQAPENPIVEPGGQDFFMNTVNVLHFDTDVFVDVCGNSNAIDYVDLRVALINNYNQALSLNSIDLGLSNEGPAIFPEASLEGFTYNSETGVLTANNPISLQSVTTDDSSNVFTIRVGIQNSSDNNFDFTRRINFDITPADNVDPEFEVSFVYGNEADIRLYESGIPCLIPQIPVPNEKLVVSTLMPDETNQCGDLLNVGRRFVGSNLTLTNTYQQAVSITEVTLNFDNLNGLDVVNSTFNGVTGSIPVGGTRLVFTFENPIELAQNSSNVFDLKLFNIDGEPMPLKVIGLNVVGKFDNQSIVETLYSTDISDVNPVAYAIRFTDVCIPEVESDVIFSSLFGGSDSSEVCDQDVHGTLSNSFLVVETDEESDYEVSSLTFDITPSENANLRVLTYQLKYAGNTVDGNVSEDSTTVVFNLAVPAAFPIDGSQVFEVLVSSNQVGATGDITLTLNDIVGANVDVDVELNYNFVVNNNLCPIVPPLYNVSAVNSISRNFCQNIEEVSGDSIPVEVVLNSSNPDVVVGATVKLVFDQALPDDVNFLDGVMGGDRTTVKFLGQTILPGRNLLSFDATFDPAENVQFDFKVKQVTYSIGGSSGEYNTSQNEARFEVDSDLDCSDDSAPFVHVVSNKGLNQYCPDLSPQDFDPTSIVLTLINPTDEAIDVNNIRMLRQLLPPGRRIPIAMNFTVDGLNTDPVETTDLLLTPATQEKISFRQVSIPANSAKDFKINITDGTDYNFLYKQINFYNNDELLVGENGQFTFRQSFDLECPDPGTVSVESVEAVEKSACYDIDEVDQTLDQRLVINNTTDSVQSLTGITLNYSEAIPDDLVVSINDVAGTLNIQALTFDFSASPVNLEVGRNVFDIVYSSDSDEALRFNANILNVVLDVDGLDIEVFNLNEVTTDINFVECQGAVQIVAFDATDSACPLLSPDYNLTSDLVIFNPKDEPLEIDKIVFKAGISDGGIETSISDVSGRITIPGVYDVNDNLLTFDAQRTGLTVDPGDSLVLKFNSQFDNEYGIQITAVAINNLGFNEEIIHDFSDNQEICPEQGVINLLPIVEGAENGEGVISELVCTDIDGLRNYYEHDVRISNGHSESLAASLSLFIQDEPVPDRTDIITLNGREFVGGLINLNLEPGMNVYKLRITKQLVAELNFELSLSEENPLYELGNNEGGAVFKIEFNDDCFRSSESLSVIDLQQSLNTCLAEVDSDFSIDMVYNNNTQDATLLNSLSFTPAAGSVVPDFTKLKVNGAGVNNFAFDDTTNTITFDGVNLAANRNHLISLEFADSDDSQIVQLTSIALGFPNNRTVAAPDAARYFITNDISDCEGLVVTGVELMQEHCALDEDQSLAFIYTVYNPTDEDLDMFTVNPEGDTFFKFDFTDPDGFVYDSDRSADFNSLNDVLRANSSSSYTLFFNPLNDLPLVEDFSVEGQSFEYELTLDEDVSISPASILTANTFVVESENCGNVVAPENILVASSNVVNFEYFETTQLPYCVYGGQVSRVVPITVLNRFSQPVLLSSVEVEITDPQGSELNYNLGDDFSTNINNPNLFEPQEELEIDPLDSYSFPLTLDTSLLYSGTIILTVNVTDLNGDPLDMPDNYTQHQAVILLDVNAVDGDVECDESDLFSFVQEKDDLIINSEGRPEYLSASDPIGKLYINNTHIELNDISNYGAIGNDWVNQGFGFKDFTLFDFVSLRSDNYFNFDLFSFEVNQSFIVGTGTEENDNLIDQLNVAKDFNLDVYRFGSAWNYRVIDNIDRRYEYTIDFNMPEVMNSVRFNLFDTLGNNRFEYVIQNNLQGILESYKIELMKDDGTNFVLADSDDGLLFAGLNITQSNLANDFSSYSSLIITLDYVDDEDEVFTPDVIFYHDENNNNVLDLTDGFSPFLIDFDSVNRFVRDTEFITWISSYTSIDDIEFFIGSPVTESIEDSGL
ncbi:hypothetical protein HOJ01_03090 [bacterium]|jgi:hypothetical protein|nr:hypothetical protein [bacterium]MBT6293770.1 hypothetical protein [bacterium]